MKAYTKRCFTYLQAWKASIAGTAGMDDDVKD
ncbi:MAG: hypothetical protein ACI83P_002481, partial [Janthinobacterium sp.]